MNPMILVRSEGGGNVAFLEERVFELNDEFSKEGVSVGKELKKLGKEHQVLCISHLAQVASCSDTHFCVRKEVKTDRTFTSIKNLSKEEKIAELSRMLGGGKAAELHAADMLSKQPQN